jgi:hypothetical protein
MERWRDERKGDREEKRINQTSWSESQRVRNILISKPCLTIVLEFRECARFTKKMTAKISLAALLEEDHSGAHSHAAASAATAAAYEKKPKGEVKKNIRKKGSLSFC